MKFKITPAIQKSMAATQAELGAAMRDPAFKAEHERMMLRYDLQEAIAKFFAKATYAKKFVSFPKRQRFHLNIEFGAGTPTCIAEDAMALA